MINTSNVVKKIWIHCDLSEILDHLYIFKKEFTERNIRCSSWNLILKVKWL